MMRWFRRICGQQGGQSATEYLGILAVVSVIVAALFTAQPGIGETIATGIRHSICNALDCSQGSYVGGGAQDPRGDGADGDGGGSADGGGGTGGDGSGGEGVSDGDGAAQHDQEREGEAGDPWWRTALRELTLGEIEDSWEFLQGAGSQVADEVRGLGETVDWAWRTATTEEQRRENGEIWQAIQDNPLGALGTVVGGIWAPIQEELDAGRPSGAAGRGAVAIVGTLFGGKGLSGLRRLRPDLDDVARRADDVPGRQPDIACAPNSFLAATPVLLADGTTVPIAHIDIGDQVLAAHPTTGQVTARPVTHLITGTGRKNLVTVTVAGATLTATDEHPFYLPAAGTWTHAEDLRAGDLLLTPTGAQVPVQAVTSRTATTTVHNLTVADLHTYYVLAGAPVLVHNAAPCPPEPNSRDAARDGQLPERSLDDIDSLRGASREEVERLIPEDWVPSPTRGENGIRYANPERRGEQVRIMPGNPNDPNPVKRGPYLRISRNGRVTDPIPLHGNPEP